MPLFHCRHTSEQDPNPCQCPIWEEDNDTSSSTLCDTCGHRAEWHLAPVDLNMELLKPGLERCKASLNSSQPCTCPIWIPADTSLNGSGCLLCGHKKGWHHSKVSDSSQLSAIQRPIKTTDQEKRVSLLSRTLSSTTEASSLRSRVSSVSSWEIGSEKNSSHRRFSTGEDLSASMSSCYPNVPYQGAIQNPSKVSRDFTMSKIYVSPINMAAEHMRFILQGLNEDEDEDDGTAASLDPSPPLMNFEDKDPVEIRKVEESGDRECCTTSSAPPLTTYIPNDSKKESVEVCEKRSSIVLGALPRFDILSAATESWNRAGNEQAGIISLTPPVKSSNLSRNPSLCQTTLSYSSTGSITNPLFKALHRDDEDSCGDDLSERLSEKCQTQSSVLPVLTKTTSITQVDQKSQSVPEVEEESRLPRDQEVVSESNDCSMEGSKPFQQIREMIPGSSSVLPISVSSTSTQISSSEPLMENNSQDGKNSNDKRDASKDLSNSFDARPDASFERFEVKNKSLVLLVSPPLSTTVFSPGDMITVIVRLKSSKYSAKTSTVDFESQLSKWRSINFQLQGLIAKTGTLDDKTSHEIVNVSRIVYNSSSTTQPISQTDWRFELQIPTHGHVRYFISLKGKKRPCLITNTSESIHVELKLKGDKTQNINQLATSKTSTRSQPTWNVLTGTEKAVVIRTMMTYNVEFLSADSLKIPYQLELFLSPDSEINESTLIKISNVAKITIQPVKDLSDLDLISSSTEFRVRHVRSEPKLVRSSNKSNNTLSWAISGHLIFALPECTPIVLITGLYPFEGTDRFSMDPKSIG
ncbi:hypothetical protein BY996DRAFT_6415831 [Phakopsora pachyrhizi]|nr:hypothetical protein BY996DRAFT_6415831 [Phakopsora pachyrhizi]